MSHTHILLPPTPRKTRINQQSTPKKRKEPSNPHQDGLRNLRDSVENIRNRLHVKLKLTFEIDDWQVHTIHRIHQGYDVIFVAGTGYGKSLIFQGLAILNKKKTIIIISPLKALERDQVLEATDKGISAAMINEDTVSAALWTRLRQCKDQMYYVSPEMALGEGFARIWKDSSFRSRVQAVIVDEAHCIEKWGDRFREQYMNLAKLRDYIGREISIVACTATCSTNTFNVIWSSLAYGFRPFWGIDVGCDRQNLSYIIKKLENTGNPVLDILNLLPPVLTNDTLVSSIPKCIFYFDTIKECDDALGSLRRVLPSHLRGVVDKFNGLMSEKGKSSLWDNFRNGDIRILCATDAAGMGCNVPDIQYVALFSVPRSISVLVQRWGR